jgi:hypothetical protein
MKKYFFIASIFTFLMISCKNDNDQNTATGNDSTVVKFSELKSASRPDSLIVDNLVKGLKHVKKRDKDYVLYSSTFDVNELKKALCDTVNPITGIKAYLGGIKKNNHAGREENMFYTIIQLQRLTSPLKSGDYSYTYLYSDPHVCPEPTPCYLEQ